MRVFAGLFLIAIVSAPAAWAQAREDGAWLMYTAYYDFEVLSFCGMVDTTVAVGLKRRVEYLLERDPWTEEEHGAARRRAWVDGHREWSNRSLGGHQAWCGGEGKAALVRLRAFAGDPSGGERPADDGD